MGKCVQKTLNEAWKRYAPGQDTEIAGNFPTEQYLIEHQWSLIMDRLYVHVRSRGIIFWSFAVSILATFTTRISLPS